MTRRAAACVAVAVALQIGGRAVSAQVTDSAAIGAVLEAVRGASPMLCELAARPLEQQWGFSYGFHPRSARDPAVRAALRIVDARQAAATVVPMLAAALADADMCVRRAAAPLLGRIRVPAAQAAVRTALRHERADVREAAALAGGYGEDAALIPALLAALQDAEPRVRGAAAWALGEIEDPRALGALIRVLRDDRDADVRSAAAWAIGSIEG